MAWWSHGKSERKANKFVFFGGQSKMQLTPNWPLRVLYFIVHNLSVKTKLLVHFNANQWEAACFLSNISFNSSTRVTLWLPKILFLNLARPHLTYAETDTHNLVISHNLQVMNENLFAGSQILGLSKEVEWWGGRDLNRLFRICCLVWKMFAYLIYFIYGCCIFKRYFAVNSKMSTFNNHAFFLETA